MPLAIRSMIDLVRERAAQENFELDYEPAPNGDVL
jgi:hypothetical protein